MRWESQFIPGKNGDFRHGGDKAADLRIDIKRYPNLLLAIYVLFALIIVTTFVTEFYSGTVSFTAVYIALIVYSMSRFCWRAFHVFSGDERLEP